MTRRAFLAAAILVLALVPEAAARPPAGPAAGRQLVYGQRGWGGGVW